MRYNKFFKTKTKAEMVEYLNMVVSRYYGAGTKLMSKVERLPKERIKYLYDTAQLWEKDTEERSMQIIVLNEHMRQEF